MGSHNNKERAMKDHRLGDEGIYYHCGCYHQGNPSSFPYECPTHGRIWKMKKTMERKDGEVHGSIVTTTNPEKET